MRKHILLFIMFSCLPWAARGQSAYEWRYWFDNDESQQQTGQVEATAFSIDADVADVDEGMHAIHVQIADTAGCFSPPLTRLFYRVADHVEKDLCYWFDDNESQLQTVTSDATAFSIDADVAALGEGMHTIHMQIADGESLFSSPQTRLFYRTKDYTVKRLRYWFDGVVDSVETVPISTAATIDVSKLEPGVHFFYCQAEDASGNVSDMSTGVFYRPLNNNVATWSYWFDEDRQARQTSRCPDGPVMVDVSALDDGFHTIYSQVSERTPSAVVSRWFIKIPQTESAADMTCICTVDEKMVGQQRVPANGGIISWDLDVSELPVGLHRAVFQVITATGAASTIAERFFVRAITPAEVGNMQCVYTLDNSDTQSQAGTMANGLFHFDLDVASLEEGLHRIAYMMVAQDGSTTPQQTAFFWKTPVGGNGIAQYDYWLNDEEQNKKSIRLDKRENPFKLISLLPVDAQPIRSECFQFEVKDGKPMLYAKNDFHIRFYDTAGRALSETRQFVDYQVGQELTDIETLEPDITATTDKSEVNSIKWYQLTAERGDSLSFKTDIACTVQLFAPSGAEVYNASGPDVVKWGGCHAPETGTFYLALHDVTAQQGTTVSIDYQHIDKYAVLRQDVCVVGNGGCSTITFEGNGFRDLYAVDLFTEQGDSIHHVYIGHESDATTSVVFDFTDSALGTYHAKFRFAEEDKVFNSLVVVEEARDIELATTVTYPSTFLRGTSTTYTIKITNNGNMTAYSVPIYAYISSETLKGVSFIRVKGLKLKNLFDYLENRDSIDDNTLREIKSLCDNMGDDHYFNKFATTDEQTGDSIVVRSAFFTIELPPNSEKTITIDIQSTERIEVWLTIPEDWHNIVLDDEMASMIRTKRSATDWLCCYHERLECIGTIVVNVADIVGMLPIPQAKAATIVSCVTGAINKTIKSTANVLCNEESVKKSFYDKVKSIADGISVTGTLMTCASGLVKGAQLKELLSGMSLAGDNLTHPFAAVDCVTAWSKKKPNCPRCTSGCGGGGSSSPVNSWEPNDMLGYVAESGSHAIKDGQTDVWYTIQFENDTVFATAPAHDIYLTDTLDVNLFDLSTYRPTKITIGEKSMELTGERNFISTLDMRPEINAIAQIEGNIDDETGIVRWHISSLDPMTMEPSDDAMVGVLPVNFDGSGLGEASYEISLKKDLPHGTVIPNRSGNIFDNNETVMTPTWTNTIDRVKPVSHITKVEQVDGGPTATVSIEAADDGSGPWRYDVYVQYGSGAWFKAAENVAADMTATVKLYEGIEHHFYCVATDMAGNVEDKEPVTEASLSVGTIAIKGDLTGDGLVTSADVWTLIGIIARGGTPTEAPRADVNGDGRIDVGDINSIITIMAR